MFKKENLNMKVKSFRRALEEIDKCLFFSLLFTMNFKSSKKLKDSEHPYTYLRLDKKKNGSHFFFFLGRGKCMGVYYF